MITTSLLLMTHAVASKMHLADRAAARPAQAIQRLLGIVRQRVAFESNYLLVAARGAVLVAEVFIGAAQVVHGIGAALGALAKFQEAYDGLVGLLIHIHLPQEAMGEEPGFFLLRGL